MQRLEHAEPQQVKLHESGGGAVVLIPLQYRPTGRPTPLHGTDLTDGSIADHHAGRVNTEVAGPIEQLRRHLFDLRPITRSLFTSHLIHGGVPKGPGDVTMGRA